jgi:peptide/nickel transport system permease protein
VLRVVLGRLVAGLILVVVLTLLTYVVFFRVPVDPVVYISPSATEEERAAIREQLGLDQPVLEQWGRFAWHLGTDADLGTSLIGGEPVNGILKDTVPPTLSLVLGGFALMLAVAIPLGMLSAIRPRSLLDRGVLVFTVVGVILHPFLIGLILRHVFAVRLDLAPGGGYCPLRGEFEILTGPGQSTSCGGVVDWLSHMWMPWVTFALFFLPLYTRLVRAHMLDNLGQLYVVTARAKGATERRIVTRHVARPALSPIAAMLAVDVAIVLTAAIYVEVVFGLPGMGSLVAQNLGGTFGYDLNVLVGVVVLIAIAITTVSLVSDVTVRALDPRVRFDGSRAR